MDSRQRQNAAFRLGNNFLRDDQDVAIFESNIRVARRLRDGRSQIVALANLGKTWNRKNGQ